MFLPPEAFFQLEVCLNHNPAEQQKPNITVAAVPQELLFDIIDPNDPAVSFRITKPARIEATPPEFVQPGDDKCIKAGIPIVHGTQEDAVVIVRRLLKEKRGSAGQPPMPVHIHSESSRSKCVAVTARG